MIPLSSLGGEKTSCWGELWVCRHVHRAAAQLLHVGMLCQINAVPNKCCARCLPVSVAAVSPSPC